MIEPPFFWLNGVVSVDSRESASNDGSAPGLFAETHDHTLCRILAVEIRSSSCGDEAALPPLLRVSLESRAFLLDS